MLDENDIITLLEAHSVRPTANRILVAKALSVENSPLSVRQLEAKLRTIDKSNIFRTLTLFHQKGLAHQIENGEGTAGYELCMRHNDAEDDDQHAHFYCENCHRTFCLTHIPVPAVALPKGYLPRSTNYIIKGLCPKCSKQKSNLL